MNDVITNGSEIKQRILSEIQKAGQSLFLAMAWFTDRDIANAIIVTKNRGVAVDIVLSSNAQNETVKQMLRTANVPVHAFESGDERGMMHHKFCLIDNQITINGSYNYSYKASNNNVENIHVSDDLNVYQQFLTEFERLRKNIDDQIDINIPSTNNNRVQPAQPVSTANSFSQQLSNLLYATADINIEAYKKQGKQDSMETAGSIQIFNANYANIKERIKMYATDDSLNSKKNVMKADVNAVFESKKAELESNKRNECKILESENNVEARQIKEKLTETKHEKSVLEAGNQHTGEKGLLQINNDIEKNRLERNLLEASFMVKKFWTVGIFFAIAALCVFCFYLSIFFASAMYKVFFEGNVIRNSLEAGINPGLPQLVDANAIVAIFNKHGWLFGFMALLFFLIPLLLSNLKLFGSKEKWVNGLCFGLGIVVFDVIVSIMVAMNTDEIKCLLVGKQSQLKIWEVVKHAEFWLIFVFGMLPLFITHFIIDFIVKTYQASQRQIVDAGKNRQIEILDFAILDLNTQKESITYKIREKDDVLKQKGEELQRLERSLNAQQNHIENKAEEIFKNIQAIFDVFIARITSGRIFTDEILSSVTAAYKSGYIEYLPELYAEREVANRVRQIEEMIYNND